MYESLGGSYIIFGTVKQCFRGLLVTHLVMYWFLKWEKLECDTFWPLRYLFHVSVDSQTIL